jgi:hypothetical protein
MRPDPTSSVFEMIEEHELTLVPVVDLELEEHYVFKDLKIAPGGIMSRARYHTTACTSVSLITGDPNNLPTDADSRTKRRLDATIERVSAIDGTAFKQAVGEQFMSWRDWLDSVQEVGNEKLTELYEASKQAAKEAMK